ncbi:MAG: NUDIX domain-containing protein [Candidatus Peribacteria bacterium]|jgi:isopentenyldiphosphate isomerase|nr:NUDIX domain-containing protein [Candidatus Peribacteria bacterium]
MTLIPVVNEQDEIITHKERNELLQEDIYRIASLWIMNEFGEILLAQRAATKLKNPNKWTCIVNGTVEKGESYEGNIIKETEEEIGIQIGGGGDLPTPILLAKELFVSNWTHFVAIFFVKLPKSTSLIFDENEIQATKWVTKEELGALLEKCSDDFVPSFPKFWQLVREKLEEKEL